MPGTVRVLVVLLWLTAAAVAAVELLNWWQTRDADYGLFVRTAWGLLRCLGFLLLIWQVRRGRTAAAPLALILSVTTLFALARLIVPRHGMPTAVGVAGFALVAALCAVVVLLCYRSASVKAHLTRHASRLVVNRKGIDWQEVQPKRDPVPGWVLTARVAALSIAPLAMVAAAVAFGRVWDGDWYLFPLVATWFFGALGASYAMALIAVFLMRGRAWARGAIVLLTAALVIVQSGLCWRVLGADGLIREGGPVLASGLLVLIGVAATGKHPHWLRRM